MTVVSGFTNEMSDVLGGSNGAIWLSRRVSALISKRTPSHVLRIANIEQHQVDLRKDSGNKGLPKLSSSGKFSEISD